MKLHNLHIETSCLVDFARRSLSGSCIIGVMVMVFGLCIALSSPTMAQYNAFDDPPARGSTTSGSGLEAVTQQVEGGNVDVGSTTQIVTLYRNNGGQPITVSDVNLYPSSNITAEVNTNQCLDVALPPGAECAITVGVKPSSPGTWRIEMLVNHDGQSRLATATISGQAASSVNAASGNQQADNEVQIIPPEIDFGESSGRSPKVRSITLRNASSNPIIVNEIDFQAPSAAGYDLQISCDELSPGQSCVGTLSWSPRMPGPSEGVLLVDHSGPSGTAKIDVIGNYDPSETDEAKAFPEPVPGAGLLIADRKEISFGTDVDGAASITVSVVNVGDEPVELGKIRLAGSDNGLSLARDGCDDGTKLSPSQACPLTVNWLPRREGPVIDDVQIRHDGARGVMVLPVRGEAVAAVSNDNLPVLSMREVEQTTRQAADGPPRLPGVENGDNAGSDGGNAGNARSSNARNRDDGRARSTGVTPTLDGYRVSSLAWDRAVIAGPTGRRVVHDGERQIIAGAEWVPEITPSGVRLIGNRDEVLLLFDNSFRSGGQINNRQISGE